MSLENFNQLLQQLGGKVGIADLKSTDDGLCSLRFDDLVTVDLEANEDVGSLIFSSVVGTLASYQVEKFYPDFLEANLFWSGTGGATIGVDPVNLNVFLCYQEKMDGMEFDRFENLLKGFSDTAIFWSKRLTGEGEEAGEADEGLEKQGASVEGAGGELDVVASEMGHFA